MNINLWRAAISLITLILLSGIIAAQMTGGSGPAGSPIVKPGAFRGGEYLIPGGMPNPIPHLGCATLVAPISQMPQLLPKTRMSLSSKNKPIRSEVQIGELPAFGGCVRGYLKRLYDCPERELICCNQPTDCTDCNGYCYSDGYVFEENYYVPPETWPEVGGLGMQEVGNRTICENGQKITEIIRNPYFTGFPTGQEECPPSSGLPEDLWHMKP